LFYRKRLEKKEASEDEKPKEEDVLNFVVE